MGTKKVKKTTNVTRPLTSEEKFISKRLPADKRKIFFTRLMAGEDFEISVKPWAIQMMNEYDLEIDKYADILEALTVCKDETMPSIDMLAQALQVSTQETPDMFEQQLNLIVPLFYRRKPDGYAQQFKKISYKFLDETAEKRHLFNGNMIDYIFFGDYFSMASAIVLAKHAALLIRQGMGHIVYIRLSNMLTLLAQKEDFKTSAPEVIADKLFERSLLMPLNKEELAILMIHTLMQTYRVDFDNKHPQTSAIPMKTTKDIEKAIAFCNQNGYSNLQQWQTALMLTDQPSVWEQQVALIMRYLMHIKLSQFSELKNITYRFLCQSFAQGHLSSDLIDFIFDGDIFSNASTVILSMFSRKLQEHNLAPYIYAKLNDMLLLLMKMEQIDIEPGKIADYLLEQALNRGLYKEEVAILNVYTLLQAFKP